MRGFGHCRKLDGCSPITFCLAWWITRSFNEAPFCWEIYTWFPGYYKFIQSHYFDIGHDLVAWKVVCFFYWCQVHWFNRDQTNLSPILENDRIQVKVLTLPSLKVLLPFHSSIFLAPISHHHDHSLLRQIH